MTGRPPRRRGVALLLTAGILAMLALAAVAFFGMAMSLRVSGSTALDRASARLLARSGVEYALARVPGDLRAGPAAGTAEAQTDDKTCRDGPEVPLERCLNPSYALAEPYEDLNRNGRYDPGLDLRPPSGDWNGNGQWDSWSGRLRGRLGASAGTFALRITGAQAGIPINGGAVNGRDASNLDAERGPAPTPSNPAPAYRPNRRLERILDNLGTIVGAAPGLGAKVIARRPQGGYRNVRELGAVLGPADYAKVAPFLSASGRPDPRAFALRSDNPTLNVVRRAFADPRIPVNLNSAPAEVLAALQLGLSSRYAGDYIDEGRNLKTSDLIMAPPLPRFKSSVQVGAATANRVAAYWAAGRPFASRYEMFRRMDADKSLLFPPPHVAQGALQGQVNAVGQFPLDPRMAQAQYVNLIVDNAFRAKRGDWSALLPVDASPGPYGFTTYDLPRWLWSDGDQRLPQTPGAEPGTDTTELALEPETAFRIESLGRAARDARARTLARAGAVWEGMTPVRARSQAGFEGEGGAQKPFKAGCRSGPMLCQDGCLDLAADLQYGYSPFVGDLRLIERTGAADPAVDLYFPFWDAVARARDAFNGVRGGLLRNRSGTVEPSLTDSQIASAILCRELLNSWVSSGWPAAAYEWGDGKPNAGLMPWVDAAGRGAGGAIDFWTDGGLCRQRQPMGVSAGCAPQVLGRTAGAIAVPGVVDVPIPFEIVLSSSPLALAFRQEDSHGWALSEAQSVVRFQRGIWNRAAFILDARAGDAGSANGFLNGVFQFAAPFEVQAQDPALPQDFQAGGDEIRIWADPDRSPAGAILSRALQPRYEPEGTYVSPPCALSARRVVPGARWDGFVPAALQGGTSAWALEHPGDPAPEALSVSVRFFSDPEGTSPIGDWRALSSDGSWRWIDLPDVRSFRYRVRMDGRAVADTESLRDTPVFEEISVGCADPRLSEAWSE